MGTYQLISGTVTDQNEVPVALARIYFTDSPIALPDLAALSGSDGTFRLSIPIAGTYTIACAADGFLPAATLVTVSAGRETTVNLRLVANPAT